MDILFTRVHEDVDFIFNFFLFFSPKVFPIELTEERDGKVKEKEKNL